MSDPFSGKCDVEYSEKFGRYLIATRDIKAGETILLEDPVIISPLWHSSPRCSNCYRETFAVCKKCNLFPLCIQCPAHHQFDCAFIQQLEIPTNFLVDNFSIFAPLKALLHLENENVQHKFNLLAMECHSDERRGQFIWQAHEHNVVRPILDQFTGSFSRTRLDEELLQKICGIFDVNAFEIRGPSDGDVLRAIYPKAALLAHSCIANTLVSVSDTYQMKIYATRAISKDEIVSYNYTSPLLGTAERRRQLRIGKYFLCECQRCKDATELGTHLSSIVCLNCSGLVTPPEDVSWTCTKCSQQMSDSDVQVFYIFIQNEIKKSEGDIRLMEMLIARYSPKLSPSHFLIIDLKQNVASVLRDICMNAMNRFGKKVLERKIQLCDDILPVLKSVEPGISRLVGIALYEKFVPLLELAKIEYLSREIQDEKYLLSTANWLKTKKSIDIHIVDTRLEYLVSREIKENRLKRCLENAECILKSSIQMLLYEQVHSAEGRLLKSALCEMRDLRKIISTIQNNIRNEKK